MIISYRQPKVQSNQAEQQLKLHIVGAQHAWIDIMLADSHYACRQPFEAMFWTIDTCLIPIQSCNMCENGVDDSTDDYNMDEEDADDSNKDDNLFHRHISLE